MEPHIGTLNSGFEIQLRTHWDLLFKWTMKDTLGPFRIEPLWDIEQRIPSILHWDLEQWKLYGYFQGYYYFSTTFIIHTQNKDNFRSFDLLL